MTPAVIIAPADFVSMKAERLLSALLLLQAHGKLPSRALAERLDVSERTVHRDMEALSTAGVPVFALRGSRGGWQLDENWRTRVPSLAEDELRALLMTQPRVVGDTSLAVSAERALAKLMAAWPATLRDRAHAIRQRLHVDTTGWRGRVENLAALPIIQDALSRDRTATIQYRQAGRERVERTVHPLGLVAKGAAWYLVANTAAGPRTYRVSRIEHARALDTPCERPTDFDLAAFWKSSSEQFERRQRYSTTLRLEPSAAAIVQAWCRVRSDRGEGRPVRHGWVELDVDFDEEADACFVVLGLGSKVTVVAPETLRDRVAMEIATMFKRSREDT
jgi:predicted DNA-binding transcriptional regulator YafY